MDVTSNNFVALADIALGKPELQKAVATGTRNGYNKREEAMYAEGDAHGQALRKQAAEAKRRALRRLPDLLEQAEANMKANGITVLWAADAYEANKQVMDIVEEHTVKTVTKSKSMLTEELGLNHVLEESDVRVVETDLGEYIIQLNNESPSHIIAPVIHKTKEEIRDIFVEKLDMTPTDDAQEMVTFAREMLRDDFMKADMGISGGNFLIAETGSLALVMNEGNGRMVTSMPKVHVALVGIEKVVETVDDYALLTQVLSRSGTGQHLTVYSNIINGPRRDDESDGPDHVYVILVDNGRSEIYAQEAFTESLACIRCGACLNGCPVYRNVGGHTYGWVYGGPIGAVLTPLYVGLDNAKPLPYASSLCGACKQVCPVDIDIPRMLLDLRAEMVKHGKTENIYDAGIKAWQIGNQSPRLFEFGGKAAQVGQQLTGGKIMPGPLGNWTKFRDFPDFAPKSFRQMWRERKKS